MSPDAKDVLALLARNIAVQIHAHHAVQIVLSLDRPYPARLDGAFFPEVRGFVIDRDVPHECRSEHATLLVVSVDAESSTGRRLRRVLEGRRVRLIEDILAPETVRAFADAFA